MTDSTGAANDIAEPDVRGVSRAKSRLVIGVLGLGLFASYTWDARSMPLGEASMPGPGLFPLIVGIAGLLFSVVTIVESLVKLPSSERIPLPTQKRGIQVGGLVLLLAVFVFTVEYIGAYAGSFVFAVLSIKLLGDKPWWKCLLFGAVISLPVIFFFSNVLAISLPGFSLL